MSTIILLPFVANHEKNSTGKLLLSEKFLDAIASRVGLGRDEFFYTNHYLTILHPSLKNMVGLNQVLSVTYRVSNQESYKQGPLREKLRISYGLICSGRNDEEKYFLTQKVHK